MDNNIIEIDELIKQFSKLPARKVRLETARDILGKLPDTPAGTSSGSRRPPPGEVLDSVSWNLPKRVSMDLGKLRRQLVAPSLGRDETQLG